LDRLSATQVFPDIQANPAQARERHRPGVYPGGRV
jgi:hypothetical protein